MKNLLGRRKSVDINVELSNSVFLVLIMLPGYLNALKNTLNEQLNVHKNVQGYKNDNSSKRL